MKKFLVSSVVAVTLLFGGCTTIPSVGTVTPKQAVITLQGAYKTALIPIATYVELPRCGVPVRPPCSTPDMVRHLQKATKVAELAVDAADSAAYTPGFGSDVVETAMIAARAAVAALVAAKPQ